MKRNIYLLLIAMTAVFISCDDKNNKPGFLDPDSKISLQGMNTLTRADNIDTIDIIIRHCDNVRFRSDGGFPTMTSLPFGEYYYGEMNSMRRDFENKRFLWSGGYVIETDPDVPGWSQLGLFITDAEDVVFAVPVDNNTGEWIDLSDPLWSQYSCHFDTLGYIPNRILKKAQQDIQEAYASGDFETCYRLFDTAFVFIPITGERWRALKEAGIE